jgi:RND family efflux transporter MFP subunit
MMKRLRNIRTKPSTEPDELADGVSLAQVPTPADSGEEKSGGRAVGLLQILAVLALIGLAVYFSREPTTPITPSGMTAAAAAPTAPQVSTIAPTAGLHQVRITGNGSVGVSAYVDLVPQISGRIAQLAPAMSVGGEFRAGETLVAIEPDDFLLQVKQAQADVAVQRANLELQQARSDAAVKNYALLNPSKSVPSLVALRPQIAQAKAQLQAAQAKAEVANLALQRTQFSLPFDGMVTQSSAQVGQLINSGKSFGKAYALDSVELVVPIAPGELAQLVPAQGRTVLIATDVQSLQARIDRIGAELDNRSRFAKAYIALPQTTQTGVRLQPGMFADVTIMGPEYPNSLVLPEASIQASGSIWYVRDGALVEHQPQILGRTDQGIVVENFAYGEGIVVGVLASARAGAKVIASPQAQAK